VRYFEGGKIHDAGEIRLKDGETLYLEGGAVVRGLVRAVGAKNVAVRGPGVLDGGPRQHKINMLVVRECSKALLEDFILLDPLGWSIHLSGSNQIAMRNTRVVGWRANSDGVDIEYSKQVTLDGCFWRTNDDCIAIKAIYPPGVKGVPFEEMINPEFIGGHTVERIPGDSMGEIEIRNCVLWNDAAGQGFEIGFELRIDEIKGVHFHDSDIIRVIGGGAFTIHNGDQAAIRDLLIENIRIEETDRLVDFHVGLSIYSADCPREYHRSTPRPQRKAPPRRPEHANNPWQWYIPDADKMAHHETFRGYIDGVTLRNVSLATPPLSASIMNGFSAAKGISNIRYENVTVEGKPLTSAAEARVEANEFVKGIEFGKR
ncbi:MAG TPA: glycosyl hydrolase family 28 protein, partial [Luteolibacter sp.]|nr:glycosyl hydrolase family 28 protein [Luteolibacter sp.]